MSQETIDLLNMDRKYQVEESPSSETFQIVGGSTFKGIFDRASYTEEKDKGNVKPKFLKPAIMVAVRPAGLTERTTKIQREDGTEYTFFRFASDDEGVPLLWLS